MQKPITLQTQDFIDSQIELIQKSGLPAFIIRYVLRDIMSQLDEQAKIQYEQDLEAYDKEKETDNQIGESEG